MSIADEFMNRHCIDSSTTSCRDSVPISSNNFMYSGTSNVNGFPMNPRQNEFYARQNAHQEHLNYLHFMHRLNGGELGGGDDINDGDVGLSFDMHHYARESRKNDIETDDYQYEEESKYEMESEEDENLKKEEEMLQRELLRQQKLLEDTKFKTKSEIDKIKAMLEKFRKDRKAAMSQLEEEHSKRKERYETDISTIRQTEPKEPDINITIVDKNRRYSNSSRVSKSSRYNSRTNQSRTRDSSASEVYSEMFKSEI